MLVVKRRGQPLQHLAHLGAGGLPTSSHPARPAGRGTSSPHGHGTPRRTSSVLTRSQSPSWISTLRGFQDGSALVDAAGGHRVTDVALEHALLNEWATC